ncbi:MAG: hypothetical protein NVSMB65_11410 [Chloroflexota bacterium]
MPIYYPSGRIVFSKEEKDALRARADAAGMSLEQHIRLLLVRGLPAVSENGEPCVLSLDLSRVRRDNEP